MAARFTRRDLLTLTGAVGGGLALSWAVQQVRPLGQDIAENSGAQQALADRAAPASGSGPVRIAVWSDFACAACRVAHPRLLAAAKAHGDVTIVWKHWPVFGAASRQAAELALAAHALGRHDAFYHRLMTAPGRLDEASIRAAWEDVGGDWPALLAARAAGRSAIDRHLGEVAQEAFTLGLRGTPAYLTRDRLVQGALSESAFGRLLG